MGRKKQKKQGCEYSKLNPNAREFVPAVVSSSEGKYSSYRYASISREIPKSSRPPPYSNNNDEKLSFCFLETHDGGTIEINEPCMDFVSELPSLVVENILQHLDVTSIQNCRKVSLRWNDIIIKLQPNVIKDIEKDAAFIRRLIDSRISEDMPEEPFYQDKKCATCAIEKDYSNNMWAIQHDLVKLITYHYECEDKSKKYDCPLCPDWFVSDGDYPTDDENESYESDTEDSASDWRETEEEEEEAEYFERNGSPAKEKAPRRRTYRNLWKHFSHILLRHNKEIYHFLLSEQKLIPMPEWCVNVGNNHQTGWIDKFTEDMIFLEHADYLLSDD